MAAAGMRLLLPLILSIGLFIISSDNESLIDEIFNLLNEGDKNIDFKNRTDFIVLIGLSGSGKSTLAHYMSGDPDTLIGYDSYGELLYTDTEGQIGAAGIVSYTLFPDVTIDLDYDIAVVDCPGFEDTRNASFEIAASYFIKKVFDSSTSVKIILTISNAGVRPGQDRHMLDNLLTNIIELVIDVDKYGDSLAMVVTKVPVNQNNDTQETGYVKGFLGEVVTEYENALNAATDPVEKDIINKKLNVLASILNETSNRIAIFRAPQQLGPISQSNYSLANKETIKHVVFNETEFVTSLLGDFDFALSAETELFVRDEVYVEIDRKVATMLSFITSQILGVTEYMGIISVSITNLKQQIDNIYNLLWDIDINTVSRDTLEILVINSIKYLTAVSSFSYKPADFTNLLNQFEFFRSFTDQLDDPYGTWLHIYDPVREWSKYLENWYGTIVSMYEVTSRAEVQKVKNEQFDHDILNMTYFVTKTNLKEFLFKIQKSQLSDYPEQIDELISNDNLLLKDFILRDINVILTLIRPNITCSNESILVRSNFVSLSSDIMYHLNSRCSNISVLNIIAFETLFVDTDLDLRDTDVSLIGNFWDVRSEVKVDISGANGTNPVPPKANQSDSNGHYDGKMGASGRAGGYFVGLANKVQNSNLVRILANGGNGGKGQDGGGGAPTEDNPESIPREDYFNTIDTLNRQCRERHYQCKKEGPDSDFKYIYYDIYKMVQQTCGSGGKSGLGASAGEVKLVVLNDNNDTFISFTNGSLGDFGFGGVGWKLPQIDTDCERETIPIMPPSHTYHCYKKNTIPKTTYNGEDDFSSLNATKPNTRGNPFQTINELIELKFYYLENQFMFDVIPAILALNNNTKILNFYNIRAFLNEFLILENKKYVIRSDLLDVYSSSMIPVVQNWPTTNYDDEQVMIFLTATLSSMIWEVQMGNGTVFVTDLYSYVQTALKNINDLNTLNTIQAVNNIKDAYGETMDANILEAQNYITKFIDQVFDEIFADIQRTMDELIEEIKVLQEHIEQNIVELRKKQQQLASNIVAHTIFGVLNVAAAALKLTGPAGTAASIAIGAASSITESLIVGGVTIDGPTKLPAGIYNLLTDLETLKQSRRLGHVETLVFNCDSYLSINNTSESNKKEAEEIKTLVLTIPGISDLVQVDEIIQGSVANLTLLFKAVNTDGDEGLKLLAKNNLSILDYAKNTTQIAGPLRDGIQNYKNDPKKLESIVDIIVQEQESLEYLSEFQEAVYQVIMPMIDTLQSELATLSDELTNQSSVSLIVKRWEITRHITELTYLIARYTEGFEVQADLVRYFNQLNEAANLVVTLFEQIQYYQEHSSFAGYIADLQSVGGGVIPDNSQYTTELVALKGTIISNNVKVQCSSIISSFIQQVFPFANLHLGSLNIANNKFCEGDDQTVINTIKTVETELDKIRDTIMSNKDQYVHTGKFDSSFVSTPPFAIWDNNTYGNEINRLMKGEAISLMAPIIGQKNAVKFNRIQIKFNRTDGGPQDELTNALKSFSIEQTHLGNSLYKCDDFSFIIRSEPLTLSYALENDANGDPVIVNNVYSKLVLGDISLSPYTMWRLKITETYGKKGIFDTLTSFTNSNVNMELYGTGQFVDKDVNVCKTRLEEYYDYYYPIITV